MTRYAAGDENETMNKGNITDSGHRGDGKGHGVDYPELREIYEVAA